MMSSEERAAAKTINEAIENVAALTGEYPKTAIQKFVEQWFVDGDRDPEYVLNVIFYIRNKRYQQTALKHLESIKLNGLSHNRAMKQNSPQEVENLKPAKRIDSPLYWTNDGGDDQFLGEFSSPIGMVVSYLKMIAIFGAIILVVGQFL